MTRQHSPRFFTYCMSLCLFYTAACQSHFQSPATLPATDHGTDGLLPTLAHTLKNSLPFNYAGAPNARYSIWAAQANSFPQPYIDLTTQPHSKNIAIFYTTPYQINDIYNNAYSSPHPSNTAPAP